MSARTSVLPLTILGISSDVKPLPVGLTVVSLHRGAINCSDLSGRRWTLLSDNKDFLPRSILVGSIPAAARGDCFTADLSGSAISFRSRVLPAPAASRWRGLIGEWVNFLGDRDLNPLYYAIKRNEPIHALTGLGPGLTPAGDDFITGWITAKLSRKKGRAPVEARGFYERWNQKATTWFSRWMIKDALRGRIWRRGAVLLNEMAAGGNVAGAVSGILDWGHTSGRAWLAGFARGFLERANEGG